MTKPRKKKNRGGRDPLSSRTLPYGTNKLAQVVGRRVRHVRELRELSLDDLSSKLGIAAGTLAMIETGKALPKESQARRIEAWIWEGAEFEDKAPPWPESVQAPRWATRRLSLPVSVDERLRRQASRLGIGQSEFIYIAIRRMLDNEPTLSRLEEAAALVREANVAEVLRADPPLRRILEGDLRAAEAIGARVVKPEEERPFAVQRIATRELPTDDEIFDDWRTDDIVEVIE